MEEPFEVLLGSKEAEFLPGLKTGGSGGCDGDVLSRSDRKKVKAIQDFALSLSTSSSCQGSGGGDGTGPFDELAIKQNENVPTRYSSVKPVMFMDCIASMVSIENNTPFSSHLYNSLGTKSKEVVRFVETKVSKSSVNWDGQIADAIAASIKCLK